MQNNLRCLALMAGLLGASCALAEVAKPDAAIIKASDTLTKIEAETLVLKARERQLAVQVAIMAKQNEIATKQGESERMVKTVVVGNPVVQSVEGIGSNKFATLELANGSVIDVRAGDIIGDGMKVVSIQSNAVMVETADKKRVRLTSASSGPAPFNPSFPSSGVSLPLLFPALKGMDK
ncbi:type IV pilus biogenesis protein PilP [Oxalobacteraceae bacterium GrIS 1.11]